MNGTRHLVVVADDFGIGPATSQGILALAARGRVTATVLLVTSPYAEAAVRAWRSAGADLELGWHPCLTLDRPVLPPARVPTLVDADGQFHRLGSFLCRLLMRRLCPQEVEVELLAQYHRFHDLVSRPPALVNAHHHLHLFDLVGRPLRHLLAQQHPLPYVRRVREPWGLWAAVPGARLKRSFLSLIGRRATRAQAQAGLPGNDCLVGVTAAPCLERGDYFALWLTRAPGRVVELACHPGFLDDTLAGRDEEATDPRGQRRAREYALLAEDRFLSVCRLARLELTAPASRAISAGEPAHAA